MRIEEVVARRSDLSTFLVHLCRNRDGGSARESLEAILREGCIRAMTPMGHAVRKLQVAKISTDSQKTVCFTETPLEHTSLLCEEIEDRDCDFQPYGIAITKKQARRSGGNPVWYLDITPGHEWLTEYVNQLVNTAIQAAQDDDAPVPFEKSAISRLTPFIEQMGSGESQSGGGYRKEFWWEREWRHVGDFCVYAPHFIVLSPEDEIRAIQNGLDKKFGTQTFIDPRWSLEQIIATMAGFLPTDIGPF